MRVYTIIHISTLEVVYVGSTHQLLCDRKANHRYSYTHKPNPVHIKMLENGGWDAYEFKTYSEHPGITHQELKIIEGRVIHELKPKYNTQLNPYRTEQDIKDYYIQYYQRNAEKKKLYTKECASKRFICECGSDVRWGEKSRHIKSDKHQNYRPTAG